MKRKAAFFASCLAVLLFLVPPRVMANVIGPSIVDMICAPLPGALGSIFGIIIAVPTLLVIALIETLVVNHLSKTKQFWRLFRWLFVANSLSSFFGLFIELRAPGSIYPAWWGFVVAYLLSAIAESPFLWLPLRRNGFRFSAALKFSFSANTASYLFLAAVVLALTAIPMYRADPTNLRRELRGQILVYHHRHSLTLLGDLPSYATKLLAADNQPYTHGFHGSSSGRMFLVDGGLRAWELIRASNSWSVAPESMSLPGRLLAVGADGETLVCGTTDEIMLVTKQGVIKTITIYEGPPIRAALSHDRRYLAYTTMDPKMFNSQAISESGWPANGTRGTMPPQFLQDSGWLHLLDLSTGISSPLAFFRGNCIGFHPSANWLAIGGELSPEWAGTVSIINVETRSTKLIWTKEFDRVISELAWSPDGKYLAFLQRHGPTLYVHRGYDASLWIITSDGNRSTPLPVAFAGSQLGLWNVAWRND